MFHGVIHKIKLAQFFLRHGVYKERVRQSTHSLTGTHVFISLHGITLAYTALSSRPVLIRGLYQYQLSIDYSTDTSALLSSEVSAKDGTVHH